MKVSNLQERENGGYTGTTVKDKVRYTSEFDNDFVETRRTMNGSDVAGYLENSGAPIIEWGFNAEFDPVSGVQTGGLKLQTYNYEHNILSSLNKVHTASDGTVTTMSYNGRIEVGPGDNFTVPVTITKGSNTINNQRVIVNVDRGITGRFQIDTDDFGITTRTELNQNTGAATNTVSTWGPDLSNYEKNWKGANGAWASISVVGGVKDNGDGTYTFTGNKTSSEGLNANYTITVDANGTELERMDTAGNRYDSTGKPL